MAPAKVDTVEEKANFFYGPYRKDLMADNFGAEFGKFLALILTAKFHNQNRRNSNNNVVK